MPYGNTESLPSGSILIGFKDIFKCTRLTPKILICIPGFSQPPVLWDFGNFLLNIYMGVDRMTKQPL